jgi:hypothetical protein
MVAPSIVGRIRCILNPVTEAYLNVAQCHTAKLTYENMLSDPLIRLMMASDGVTPREFSAVMENAREAVVARQANAPKPTLSLVLE